MKKTYINIKYTYLGQTLNVIIQLAILLQQHLPAEGLPHPLNRRLDGGVESQRQLNLQWG